MATIKQRRALDKLVENRGNVSLAMKEAGYDLTTAKNPKNLTDSKGFKELMEEYGLTEGLVSKALVSDIQEKPKRRVRELELAADILKMRGPQSEKGDTQIVILNITGTIAGKYGQNLGTDQSPE